VIGSGSSRTHERRTHERKQRQASTVAVDGLGSVNAARFATAVAAPGVNDGPATLLFGMPSDFHPCLLPDLSKSQKPGRTKALLHTGSPWGTGRLSGRGGADHPSDRRVNRLGARRGRPPSP
jgi:hypothetical protein